MPGTRDPATPGSRDALTNRVSAAESATWSAKCARAAEWAAWRARGYARQAHETVSAILGVSTDAGNVLVEGTDSKALLRLDSRSDNMLGRSENGLYAVLQSPSFAAGVACIDSASALKELSGDTCTRVRTLGYVRPGDGGDGFYWCDTSDTNTQEDRGSVWIGPGGERWKLELGTVITGAQFGILPDVPDIFTPLTNAIAMANGRLLSIAKNTYRLGAGIYTYVDRLGGNCTIDFNGSRIEFSGVRTQGSEYDWFWGVLSFYGKPTGKVVTSTLTATATRGKTSMTLASVDGLVVGSYYTVTTNPAGTTFADHIIDRFARVATADPVALTIDLDFVLGYDLPAGLDIAFAEYVPINGIKIRNVTIEYTRDYQGPNGTDQNKMEAHSGVVFRYALNCFTWNVEYIRNPKQAVHHSYTIGCEANTIRMTNPVETNSGGYCVQFERSHTCRAHKLLAWRERHVLDVTASSNVRVTQCHAFNTANASFTTHGAYEHDLHYEDCIGHFQLAGSGPSFGQSVRNVCVVNHRGTILNIPYGSIDVTLIDCIFTSLAHINLDGFVAQRTQFLKDMQFFTFSQNSLRENLFDTCAVWFGGTPAFGDGVAPTVTFRNCTTPNGIPNGTFTGEADLVFEGCVVKTTSTQGTPVLNNLGSLIVRGGVWRGTNLYLTSPDDQVVVFDDVEIDPCNRPTTIALFNIAKPSGTLAIKLRDVDSRSEGARHLTAITRGADLQIALLGNTFDSGSIRIDAIALGAAGWFRCSDNTWIEVQKTLPVAANNVVISASEITT